MFQLIQLILQNLTFFALHLKNLTSFPKPLSAHRERELLQKTKQNNDLDACLFVSIRIPLTYIMTDDIGRYLKKRVAVATLSQAKYSIILKLPF